MSLFTYGLLGTVSFKIHEVYIPDAYNEECRNEEFFWPAQLPQPHGKRARIVGTTFQFYKTNRQKLTAVINKHFGTKIHFQQSDIFFLQPTDDSTKNQIIPVWLYPMVVPAPVQCVDVLLDTIRKTARTPEIDMAINLLVRTKELLSSNILEESNHPKNKTGKRAFPDRKGKSLVERESKKMKN